MLPPISDTAGTRVGMWTWLWSGHLCTAILLGTFWEAPEPQSHPSQWPAHGCLCCFYGHHSALVPPLCLGAHRPAPSPMCTCWGWDQPPVPLLPQVTYQLKILTTALFSVLCAEPQPLSLQWGFPAASSLASPLSRHSKLAAGALRPLDQNPGGA